jgi:colanic acid/amylovoran biosynthesis glycosyltransferase
MNEGKKPVVAHVMRGYLGRTETFIGNQVFSLENYRPIILCHHRIDGHSYPFDDIVSINDIIPKHSRVLDSLVYRSARILTPMSANALFRHAISSSTCIIHFHYLVDARFFLPFKRIVGLPTLVSAYGYDVSSFLKRYWGYGKKYLKPLFDETEFFIAMSQDMKQDMINLGCPEEKIIIHYHGIDTKRFAYPERIYTNNKDEVRILICGTLEIKKAQHLVLEALRLIEQRQMTKQRFHVILVGDGPMRSYLERQVTGYGWENIVTFAGHIPHHEQRLDKEYQKADIFSLASNITVKGDKEGIPGTIVEAMASGLPVVSTYHAGIPEVIESGKNGLLVKEKDVEALAYTFADLIDNPSQRERIGCAASEKAINELDLYKRTRNLERIYASLLNVRK